MHPRLASAVDDLPAALRDETRRAVEAAHGALAGAALADAVASSLPAVFAASPFVADACLRDAPLLAALGEQETLLASAAPGAMDACVREAIAGAASEGELMSALRRVRRRCSAAIAWCDLAGWSRLERTLAALSALAEACIGAALRCAHDAVRERHGEARDSGGRPQELTVVAMGKLGGGELNFSSDVDLVYLFGEEGESDGRRVLSNQQYFARVCQRLIRLLDERTADGFVYRVDSRLRPFGRAGALALSLPAFETYLQRHGRDWERYAYVKARALTGAAADRDRFDALVRPFVYRRYLDFGVFEALRDMKRRIAAEATREELREDVKLGAGGIREVEFVVQAFQLLRGGQDPALRQREIGRVLPLLAERRLLGEGSVAELRDAYAFLRQVENRLQAQHDRQEHTLPADPVRRARLALAMGCGDWEELAGRLERHRRAAADNFAALMLAPGQGAEATDWRAYAGEDGVAALRGSGWQAPDAAAASLAALRDGGLYRRLGQHGRERLDALLPRLLEAVAGGGASQQVTLERLLLILNAVGRRSAYFALLNENPVVLRRLVDLCARSSWVAARVADHPLLLDVLIDPRIFETPPDRAGLAEDLEQRLAAAGDRDLERHMDVLREFQQASTFQVAVADLSDVLPLMKVSDRLCDIAELVVAKVIELAETELRRRHGVPRCGAGAERREAGFAVVAYGKFGGYELGYGSDLDVVFLHDSAGADERTDGERQIENARYFVRLAQRVLHMLATPTAAGVLYEVDTRLRPSGTAGPLVSNLDAFISYQNRQAWLWEHQALLRARAVAGTTAVCAAFERLRREVLLRPRDGGELRRAVAEMRERMRAELASRDPQRFDIKADRGGLVDIEFLVQYWVLEGAAASPELIRWTDNIRQLDALALAGRVDRERADRLVDLYRGYRHRLHRLALDDLPGVVAATEFVDARAAVEAIWSEVFG